MWLNKRNAVSYAIQNLCKNLNYEKAIRGNAALICNSYDKMLLFN